MTHTFEEILTCNPANPNQTSPEAAIPPRAWGNSPGRSSGPPPPLHPRNPPPMAPDSQPPCMGHRRPTHFATTPTPGHQEGKTQREGPEEEGGERHQVRGTHPREQGTAGNRTPGQGITEGHQHWEQDRAGIRKWEDARMVIGGTQNTGGTDNPPPNSVNGARPPGNNWTGNGTPESSTDHPRGTHSPRSATEAQNQQQASHTGSNARKGPARTCRCTLTARR